MSPSGGKVLFLLPDVLEFVTTHSIIATQSWTAIFLREAELTRVDLSLLILKLSHAAISNDMNNGLSMSSISTLLPKQYQALQIFCFHSIKYVVRSLRTFRFNAAISHTQTLLQDGNTLQWISTMCCLAIICFLILATRGVDMEAVQHDFEPSGESPVAAKRRSTLRIFSDSSVQADTKISTEKSLSNESPALVASNAPSAASWNEVNKVKVKTPPKSRWLSAGTAAFFSRLSPRKRADTDTYQSEADGYNLSTNGLKHWSPSSPSQREECSSSGSVLSVSPVSSPRSALGFGNNAQRRRSKSNRDVLGGFVDDDDCTSDDFTEERERYTMRRSISLSEVSRPDPRDLIGWQIEVKGQGRGVIKDVKKSRFFGKDIFDVDFGTGKITKITNRRERGGEYGLPFKLIRRLI